MKEKELIEIKMLFVEKYKHDYLVYRFIEGTKQTTITQISENLNISPPLVSYKIRRLLFAGFIKRVKNNRGVNTDYADTEHGRYMFQTYFKDE